MTQPAQTSDRFVNPDPVAWIQQHFYIPELRGPITIYPYQERAIYEALRVDPLTGLFVYSTCLYSDIKKSAKSTIVAAVALWRAFQVDALDGWGSIYIIANDLKQADSRVAYYMRRAIELNPELRAVCKVRNYKTTLPNHTFIEAIPIDPTGEAGSNADMVVFSELWGAHSKAQERMWTEATLPPNKFGKSQRWVETYAGYEGESTLLWNLYEQAVKPEQQIPNDLEPPLEMYANPHARMFALWNTIPRLPWQTPEYYAQERSTLMPSEFDRVHGNKWSQGSQESYLPDMALWDACKELRGTIPPPDRRTQLVIGIDGAFGRKAGASDCFAVVGISRHPNDRTRQAVRLVKTWQAKAGEQIDGEEVESYLRWLWNAYAVQVICYDPAMLQFMAQRLSRSGEYRKEWWNPNSPKIRGGALFCEEFSQATQRVLADGALLDRILDRGIAWDESLDGAEMLREHLSNADQKKEMGVKEGRSIRVVKREEKKKIDLVVAASQASYRAAQLFG